MKGAVLHKMGLNYVKERMLRRNYGVSHYRDFNYGKDPIRLQGEDAAGDVVCFSVMNWYANKVPAQLKHPLTKGTKSCNWSCGKIEIL